MRGFSCARTTLDRVVSPLVARESLLGQGLQYGRDER